MVRQAILFINGQIDLEFCESYIKQYLPDMSIYCADGAFNQIQSSSCLSAKVQMVIGDGDSIENATLAHIPYQLYKEQSSTDFEKSLVLLSEKGYTSLTIFGFGGKEMDHYLGNISTLLAYQDGFDFSMIDRYGSSQLLSAKLRLTEVQGKMISIVPLFELSHLSLQGFAFNLDKQTLRFGEQVGTRNHAVNQEVFIDYEKGNGMLFVSHFPYHQFK